MKKIKIIIFIVFTTFLFVLLTIFVLAGQKRESDIEIYTIKEARSYIYEQNECLYIDLYSNKEDLIIAYPEKNSYYFILENNDKIPLLNVSVKKSKCNEFYIYTINYYLPSLTYNETFENVILYISNEAYDLNINIGKIKIINEEYTLLNFNNLYASYSYINNELYLVGINIEIENDFTVINSCKLADTANSRLDLVINELQNTEISIKDVIPNYNFNRVISSKYTTQNKTLFIPLTYNEAYFIRKAAIEFVIDGTKYLIDAPTFIINNIDISQYENLKIQGEIEYA